jgi:RNA polymerase sigma-70 factor (ECF subfamily)
VDREAPDATIVERIASGAAGAREAEVELCRRYAPRIRLYGLRHLRDEDRAGDLVQAVLLAVLVAVRAGRVDDPGRIDRFVLGTCRNVAVRVRQTQARAESVASLDEVPAEEAEPVDLEALVRCLAGLDARGRMVVLLSFHEGHSADEVAARLGVTTGNARVLRHRAVAALRRCIDEPRGDPR